MLYFDIKIKEVLSLFSVSCKNVQLFDNFMTYLDRKELNEKRN
jgi:hypothetical protein